MTWVYKANTRSSGGTTSHLIFSGGGTFGKLLGLISSRLLVSLHPRLHYLSLHTPILHHHDSCLTSRLKRIDCLYSNLCHPILSFAKDTALTTTHTRCSCCHSCSLDRCHIFVHLDDSVGSRARYQQSPFHSCRSSSSAGLVAYKPA